LIRLIAPLELRLKKKKSPRGHSAVPRRPIRGPSPR
jgi:hypothetical protein